MEIHIARIKINKNHAVITEEEVPYNADKTPTAWCDGNP